jgi:hypothetical protein
MSKRNRARRGAPAGPARAAKASAQGAPGGSDLDRALEQAVPNLLTTIAAGDLVQAEIAAAATIGLPRAARTADPAATDARVSRLLVDWAVRVRTPESAALLRLLMSLGSATARKRASLALGQLTGEGVYPPASVTEIGKAVPVQAWRRYDVFGDEETIVVTFRYGEVEHGIAVGVDRAGMPMASFVRVAADPATLIQVVTGEGEPFERHEPIGLGEARRRLEEPLATSDEEPETADLSPDSIGYLPVARSRVRRLPAPDAQSRVFTGADRSAAVDEFMKSALAAEAVAADEESTRFWAEVLTGYSGRTPGEPPGQVGPGKLLHILLGHVPNTFALSPAQRSHLEPAVTAWTRWSAAQRNLDDAATTHLMASLPYMFARFDAGYADAEAAATRGYVADLAAGDVDVRWLAQNGVRRAFAVPTPQPDGNGRLPDVGDPAIRRALIEAEFAGCTPPGGMTSGDFLAAVHRVVGELWRGEPEATWQEATRMLAGGSSRHQVIHALALCLARGLGGGAGASRGTAVQLGQHGDGVMGGRMRVVAPPDHPNGDRRGVSQRPEDNAVAPVLGRRAFWGDADAAAGRDDREPVVDVACIADAGLAGLRPQVRGGGPGAPVDQQSALRYLLEADGAPPGPRVVGREGAVAPFIAHDGAGEALAVGGCAQYRDVAQALGQAAGG